VRLRHHMKREKSGLAFTTLELVQAEEHQGHTVELREPLGDVLYGGFSERPDMHLIHSQISPLTYHDNVPKVMWMHGEPLSSVGNGVSMRAIVDLASVCEAFICMRPEEHAFWQPIKRTFIVPKGIDLQRFAPMAVEPFDPKNKQSKLSGEPAVLYAEHWRGQRNPLVPLTAMKIVAQVLPKARLHLFNLQDAKMQSTFSDLIAHCKYTTFVRSLLGPVPDADVPLLYNRADIVVSGLYPLYARSIEAFGCGKAFIGAGYKDPEYPFGCEFTPEAMADAIIKAWEAQQAKQFDFRAWAEKKHDVHETVRQSIQVYQRYQ
jgi:glycosyltransferase involved in cell wall biosynthesis